MCCLQLWTSQEQPKVQLVSCRQCDRSKHMVCVNLLACAATHEGFGELCLFLLCFPAGLICCCSLQRGAGHACFNAAGYCSRVVLGAFGADCLGFQHDTSWSMCRLYYRKASAEAGQAQLQPLVSGGFAHQMRHVVFHWVSLACGVPVGKFWEAMSTRE
ncbi:hypothetical protein COO60DRAFT_9827 [Scenedesmus sp. NREL 46B-D3]|nr:hypothetical protein COO60DRAFT_9827 [Scenedesmus sp. NREL 46B-D3]